MEIVGILLAVFVVGALLVTPILLFRLLFTLGRLHDEMDALRLAVRQLLARQERKPGDVAHEAAAPAPKVREADRPVPPPPAPAPIVIRKPMPPPEPSPAPSPVAPSPAPSPKPVPKAPPAVATQTPFDRWVAGIGAVIADWFLVRGRFAPRGTVSRETSLAVQWLIRAGILTVIVGIAFFVRWAIARGVLGPQGRCVLTALAGLALLGGGAWLLRTRYRPVGEGLAGIGAVALYFAIYAATAMFALWPVSVGFGGMVVVTLGVGAFALGARLPAVATLVTVGGMLTPVLLRGETANLPVLYLYLGLLALCVGAGAWWRRWDALAALGCVLAWCVTLAAPWRDVSQAWVVLLHLLAVAYAAMALLRGKTREAWLPFAAQLMNLAVFWGVLFFQGVPDAVGASLAATLAIVHALFAILTRHLAARRLTWCGVLMALVDLALGVTFLLGAAEVTVAWCLLAIAAVELGHRVREPALAELGQGFACIALVVALGVTLVNVDPGVSASVRRVTTCLVGVLLVGAHALLRADILRESIGRGLPMAAWCFLLLDLPIFIHLFDLAVDLAFCVATLGVAAIGLLLVFVVRPRGGYLRALALALFGLAVALLLFAFLDLLVHEPTWLRWTLVLAGGVLALGMRWMWFVAVTLGAVRNAHEEAFARNASTSVAFLIVWALLTRLSNDFGAHWGNDAANASVSVTWALFALYLIILGFRCANRAFRLAALALFGLTLAKVFFYDLAELAIVWRVAVAIPVGLLLILAAVLYLRLSPKPPDKGD